MDRTSEFFGSFAVADLATAHEFYERVLGIDTSVHAYHMELNCSGARRMLVYAKPDHRPADFTVLNIPVPDLRRAVAALRGRGVRFEHYGEGPLQTDAEGIHRDECATIAWFRDPSGNYMALIEEPVGQEFPTTHGESA